MTQSDSLRQNIQEYNLSVGQFAKLCGTTRDTLRHYYETGLLMPRIDEANGYHYYSASQVSSFFFISTFRQTGYSIKEIHSIIYDSSKEKIRKLANIKMLDMQRELFVLHNKIASMQLGLWLLEKYDENKSYTPFFERLENISIARTAIQKKDGARHAGDIAPDIATHINAISSGDNLSVFPTGVTMAYDDIVNKKYNYNNVISLSILPADNVNTFALPSSTVVSCYHDHHASDIEQTYQQIASFIKEHQFKACSDLHIISLYNLYDTSEHHTYFKYMFICVEKDAPLTVPLR